nr:MAG TPA: hypothetical protein [Bacteriophage sp.]
MGQSKSYIGTYQRLVKRKAELSKVMTNHESSVRARAVASKQIEQLDESISLVKFQISVSEMRKNRMVGNLRVTTMYSDDNGDVIAFKNNNGIILTLESIDTSTCGFGVDKMDVSDLDISEFDGMTFTFSFDDMGATIERVEGSGIRLKPDNGHPVFIPCRNGSGWYSDKTILVLKDQFGYKVGSLDITECLQVVEEETE